MGPCCSSACFPSLKVSRFAQTRNHETRDNEKHSGVSLASTQGDSCPRIAWDQLTNDADARLQLCQALESLGFVIIEAPPGLQAAVVEMQVLANEFFQRPNDERRALGKLRLFKHKVIGYRELGGGGARFLEVHAVAGGGAVPNPRIPRGFGKVAVQLHTQLQAMGRSVLTWLADHAGVPSEALLQSVDEPSLSNIEDADCSASVLRLCCYGFDGDSNLDTAKDISQEPNQQVTFDEHTDASFLTLAPVGSQPGLQMRHPASGDWLDVEKGLRGQGAELVVFVGDFVELLTKGKYAAARHRVIAPSRISTETYSEEEVARDGAAIARRLSMPFLMRGQPESIIDTTPFVQDGDTESALLRLEPTQLSHLRQFLDLKGRSRFSGQKLLPAKPEDAK